MLSLVEKLIQVTGIPLFYLSVISLFFFHKNRIIIFSALIIASLCLLRVFYPIQASRYYSFFILPFLLFLSVVFYQLVKHKMHVLLFAIFSFVIIFEIQKSFHRTSIKYIYAIQDACNHSLTPANNQINYVPEDLAKRLSITTCLPVYYNDSKQIDFLRHALQNYRFWGYPISALMNFKKQSREYLYDFISHVDLPYRIKGFFPYGRHNNSFACLLEFDTTVHNREQALYSLANKSKSLIPYGDMEESMPKEQVKKVAEKWINDGAVFYSQDSLLFPRNGSSLLNFWSIYPNKDYPDVYLDDNDPIDGKYSLHVKLKTRATPLYLFNIIPSQHCILSFKVKSISGNTLLNLHRYDYESKTIITPTPDRDNYILLKDNDIHTFHFVYSADEFLGDSSLFILSGSNTEYLLDDVSCYPITINSTLGESSVQE